MTARHRLTLVLTLTAVTGLLGSGQAIARPPAGAAAQKPRLTVVAPSATPLIGRVRMRGEVLDLTRVSIAAGGPAHEVAQGTARIIADAEVPRTREREADLDAKR